MTPSINDIRKTNKESENFDLKNPVAVFVGGTSGIGEHTAYEFVKHTHSPTCYIIGRNATAGEQILSQLKELNSNENSQFHFIKKDVTLIKECDKLCDEISSKEEKINMLFLSSGFLTMNGRTENEEGLDTKLAVNYYGRWRIVDNLMPLVKKAADNNEPARVVSVLQPGNEGPVEEDDLELKNKFSLTKANRHIVEFNSLAVTRFAELYPTVSFNHAHPGVVGTGISRELPWLIRGATSLLMNFSTSVESSAEKFYYMGYSSPDFAKGSFIVDSKCNDFKDQVKKKGYLSNELQEKVWKHTEDKFAECVAK